MLSRWCLRGRALSTSSDPAKWRGAVEGPLEAVSGFVWGPIKRRGDKAWVAEKAAPKRGRRLLTELQHEMEAKSYTAEPWRKMTHFRSGDGVLVRYVTSLTQKKENVFRGLCVGKKRTNGWAAGFWVRNIVAGEEVAVYFKTLSPMLRGVEVTRKRVFKAKTNKLNFMAGRFRKFVKGRSLPSM